MNLRNKLAFFIALNSYVEMIVRGTSPLSLPDAIANSLSYVKAFGGTYQGLPSGYTPLEYIEMTGAQYLDTGITGYANTNVLKTKINASQVSATCFITFQNPNSGADNLGLFLSSSRWNFQYGSPSRVTALASANTDVSIEATNGIMKINGVSVTGTPASEFSISEPILIGTSINGTTIEGRKFQGKIYYFRWEDSNGNVLFDGVPAKDSNNVAGMYDTVSGRFLTNQGSGSITAGPAVTPTPTPTPDAPMNIVCNNGTIKVRRQSGLPWGYTLLDFVTNASGTSIDTGIYDDIDDFSIEMRVKPSVGSWYICQSRASSTAQIYGLSGSLNGLKITMGAGFLGGSVTSDITRDTSHIYTVIGSHKNGVLTLYVKDETTGNEDTQTTTYDTNDFTAAPTAIGVWGQSSNTVNTNNDIYYLKIRKGGELVTDYVPCQYNGENGFYDFVSQSFFGATAGTINAGSPVSDPAVVYADGTVETIEDTIGNTATAEMLLKVGDYTDVQEILSGKVKRNVGIKILDGTESWVYYSIAQGSMFRLAISDSQQEGKNILGVLCTHYTVVSSGSRADGTLSGSGLYYDFVNNSFTSVADWKAWLAQQFANGTPVIVVYPLATATTETVTGQTLQVQAGDNTLEITQASMSGLELEAKYKKRK